MLRVLPWESLSPLYPAPEAITHCEGAKIKMPNNSSPQEQDQDRSQMVDQSPHTNNHKQDIPILTTNTTEPYSDSNHRRQNHCNSNSHKTHSKWQGHIISDIKPPQTFRMMFHNINGTSGPPKIFLHSSLSYATQPL
jgi:hypothetical protein